jgi:putative oxidoreductase
MKFLDRFSGPLLSVLRIVSALLFMCHGTMKLFQFPPSDRFGEPRIVAFVLSGQMAVAYFMAHAPQGFYPLLNGGESAVLFCFVFLYIAAAGGGPWSLDRLFFKPKS